MPRILLLGLAVTLLTLAFSPLAARAQALRSASPIVETPNNTPAAGSSALGAAPEGEMPAYPKGPIPSQGFNKPRSKAVSMVKLTQINSSTWQDPEGHTWYTSEYWVANTAAYEICDVKLAIPLASGVNSESVRINSSFALVFGGVNDDMASSSNTYNDNYNNDRNNGNNADMPYAVKPRKEAVSTLFFNSDANELTASLSPPYVRALRVKESVDIGFTLAGSPGLAQTDMARVVEARYCDGGIEEMPKRERQGQQQQDLQQLQPNGGGNVGNGQQQGAEQQLEDVVRRPEYAADGH